MRADRLLAIMMRLQTRGKITTQALADELEVSRRTILRDVEALSIAGIPIYAQSGRDGGVTLDEDYRLSLTGLKESEVRALFLLQNADVLSDIGLGEAVQTMLPKLFAALPSLHQSAIEHLRQRVHIDPAWWMGANTPPFLAQLLEAVYEDRCLRVRYEHHDGEVVERVIQPYSLVAKTSIWYLLASRDGEFRTYRVSRFHDVQVLDEHFHRQPDFDPAAYWRDHLHDFLSSLIQYKFTLRIHTRKMNFVHWYATGRYTILESTDQDEWFTASFEAESIEPAIMFVFGLGADAVVLEPPELVQAIRTQALHWLPTNPP